MAPKRPDVFLSTAKIGMEVHAAIGAVAAEWSLFEHAINRFIWELAEVEDEVGACITSQIISIRGRLDAAISLCRLRGAPDGLLKDLNRFAEASNGLGRQRNRIVHDTWSYGLTTGKTYRLEVTADKRPVFEFKDHSESEILQTAIKLAENRAEWGKLATKILDALPTSPKTRPGPSA
jgi:hypothetical protein